MAFLERNANRGSVSTKYRVENSIKLEHRNQEWLYRDNPTAGNRRTFTISMWFKRGFKMEAGDDFLMSQGSNARYHFAADTIRFMFSGNSTELESVRKLRDTSAWYHVVLAVDTTQATASNRVKCYVNGQQNPWSNTKYPSQNEQSDWMNTNDMYLGGWQADGSYDISAYFAEVAVIDGTQYAASDFGEYDDDSGIWVPKDFKDDVTFGNEGFYLEFKDSSSSGADTSGNNNHLADNNVAAADHATDTPTNNFCVLNQHVNIGNQYGRYVQRHREGNTQPDEPTGSFGGVFGTHSFSSGKWYWEAKSYFPSGTAVNLQTFGVASCKNAGSQEDNVSGFHPGEATYGMYPSASTGIYPTNAQTISYKGTTANTSNDNLGVNADGNIWQIAFDADNGKVWFGKNDTWMNTTGGTSVSKSDIAAGNNPRYDNLNNDAEGPWIPCFGMYNANSGHHMDVNFGGYTAATPSSGNADQNGYGNFEYEPPSGFLAICSENLGAETSIDDPSEYFQETTYTGTGSTQSITNSGNSDLQPDLVWVKKRNGAESHALADSTRGTSSTLFSNNEAAESTSGQVINAFNSDGFQVGTEGIVSDNGNTYVAWQWKANGGTTSSNSDGNITSTVQANTTAGFSIVTWTGDGSTSGKNVGHGLGAVPSFIFTKDRGGASNLPGWYVYHPAVGNEDHIQFTSSASADSPTWGDTDPTSSVFSVGGEGAYIATNQSSTNYVAYCFAEKEGYSIFGKYEGNGYHNTAGTYPTGKDGPFIHTGFRPALIFIKRIDNTGSWTIYGHKRGGYNNNNDALFWNFNIAEAGANISGSNIDIFSNGFKVKSSDNTINASGATYMYGAWAVNPQQTSKGIPCTGRMFD